MKKSFYPFYYLLSWTWGIFSTLPGAFLALCLILLGQKPHRIGPAVYFRIGKHWGGMEMGMFFLRDETSTEHVTYHEAGHSLQTIVLGPLMLPLITIPSFLRYHYRNFLKKFFKKKAKKLPPYDSIWFEGQASKLGYRYFKPLAETAKAETKTVSETVSAAVSAADTAENKRVSV